MTTEDFALNVLKPHIIADPDGRGYFGMTDKQVAQDINTQIVTLIQNSWSGPEVRAEMVQAEYNALPDAKKLEFLILTQNGEALDLNGQAKDIISGIFSVRWGGTTGAVDIECFVDFREIG